MVKVERSYVPGDSFWELQQSTWRPIQLAFQLPCLHLYLSHCHLCIQSSLPHDPQLLY
jgi:hypothetical protein